jgi:hypothetical protein
MPGKGCHVCLTKTKADMGEVGRHGEPAAVAKAEPAESKLKEARFRAQTAIHPSVNAALVIEEFSERLGDLQVGQLAVQLKEG